MPHANEEASSGTIGIVIGRLDPFKYALGIAYSAATVRYLARHRREVEQSYSNVAHVNLRWLLWLSAATACIWLLVTTLKIAHVSTTMRDGHVAIAITLLVYGIGYLGLRQPEFFRYDTTAEFPVQVATDIAQADGQPAAPPQVGRIVRDDGSSFRNSLRGRGAPLAAALPTTQEPPEATARIIIPPASSPIPPQRQETLG